MVSIHCPLVLWPPYWVWNPPLLLPLYVDFTSNIADLSLISHLSLYRASVVNTHLEGCLCLFFQCDDQRLCFLGKCTEGLEEQIQSRLLFCLVTSDVSPKKKQNGQHINLVQNNGIYALFFP